MHIFNFFSGLTPAIATVIAALIGGFFGSLLVPYVTFKFNHRLKQVEIEAAKQARQGDIAAAKEARRLDFYKIVYPERFKIAKQLLDDAGEIYSNIRILRVIDPDKSLTTNDLSDPSSKGRTKYNPNQREILEQCIMFESLSESSVWILNDNINRKAGSFYVAATTYTKAPQQEQIADVEISFHALCDSVKVFLRFGENEDLLTEQSPPKQPVMLPPSTPK